ncbi:phosphate ABC transporter substrate-binding protein PstS [Motilibacter deserti]|uniref:Phosphate-binding protein n=1 Tax=Motilibacter deserti TaxID=2714956 RepID=A0ABX0GZ57_9ACTN|nr:phosphate ABC transporter substrate-binding protein PstS [Motilibacter deserti]
MKLHRFGRLSVVALAGSLALAACGSDDNSDETTGSDAPAASAGSSTAPDAGSGGIACPAGGGTLNGAGSSAQQNAVSEWTKAFQEACPDVTINYNASGSGAGRQAFIDKQVAWAGSDSSIKEEEKTQADANCTGGQAINLPMVVGPIAVAYNIEGVDELNLSAKTIAGIFTGQITKWNAAEITAENPDADLPDADIVAVHRSDESGTTQNFARYLDATAKDIWTYGTEQQWPAAIKGGQGANKSAGVADAVSRTAGAIGYVEYSFVEDAGLSAAKVSNDGQSFVELTPENAAAAVADAEVSGTAPDLALSLNYATTAANAYPIVLVTYEIACSAGQPAADANLVKSFLTYTSSTEGQALLTDNGYAPLPEEVRTQVAETVAAITPGA